MPLGCQVRMIHVIVFCTPFLANETIQRVSTQTMSQLRYSWQDTSSRIMQTLR